MAQKFHERFDIQMSTAVAKQRFVNRVQNVISHDFLNTLGFSDKDAAQANVLTALGIKNRNNESPLEQYIKDDFWLNVQGVESLYAVLRGDEAERVNRLINHILSLAEVDIGIRWHKGHFLPSGSPLLDDKLVNDILRCLQSKMYDGVRKSFNKGLEYFLHSISKPQLRSDVVTDMYEALEALAKIVTGRGDKDLSANREPFIKAVQISDAFQPILKEYIGYGNKIRHAGKDGQPKPDLTRKEVESFVYLTGVFIRLAVVEEAQA